MKKNTRYYMRLFHRYLGFFLAGVMAMYAISGIVMIFRSTDFFKQETEVKKELAADLSLAEVGKQIRFKNIKAEKTSGDIIYFDQGSYNRKNGETLYTVKRLPYFLDRMTRLHKANTNSPVYWFNIFFGLSLLFFVISAFWMFMPRAPIFKKGIVFSIVGIILTLILLFV